MISERHASVFRHRYIVVEDLVVGRDVSTKCKVDGQDSVRSKKGH